MSVRTIGELGSELPQAFRGQPSAVTAAVRAFQLEHGEAVAAARVVEDQGFRARSRREEAAKRHAELSVAVSRGVELDTSGLAKYEREIAETNAEIEGLRPRAELLSATIMSTGGLLRNLESYARDHLKGADEARLGLPASLPKLAKDQTWVDAIEKRRRRIRELRADVDRYRAAPQLSSVALQREIERIDALAAQGAPDASNAIERGGDVEWPLMKYKQWVMGGCVEFRALDLSIIAHLCRDRMVAAAKVAIEAAADDAAALSDADRARLIGDAERDALAAEREECALIKAAKAAGQPALFRSDTDPRALLGLADDMPAPAAQR